MATVSRSRKKVGFRKLPLRRPPARHAAFLRAALARAAHTRAHSRAAARFSFWTAGERLSEWRGARSGALYIGEAGLLRILLFVGIEVQDL